MNAAQPALKIEDETALCERMAEAVVAIIREKGGCLPQDLAEKGFTPAEVDRHWTAARIMAAAELKISGR